MKTLKRRHFLSLLPGVAGGAALIPFVVSAKNTPAGDTTDLKTTDPNCWLDVSAPFIIEDDEIGIHTEIILTSDTFVGARGYEDGADATEYEIYLYNADGKPVGADGVAKRLTLPAMHTTVLNLRDILGGGEGFFGGMKIRLRPKSRMPMHTSDLFSSAFVRLTSKDSFDNVHANPDPLEWQRPDSFFYSMPFPPLHEYECVFSLFNPYNTRSTGEITLYDPFGQKLKEAAYDLKPHSSVLFDLRTGDFVNGLKEKFGVKVKAGNEPRMITNTGGTIAVSNQQGTVKNFGYLLIRQPGRPRFSIDHPIHQSPFRVGAATVPFDAEGRFKAKNILYTPLLFRSKQLGGITLESRFHFSSGAPIDESLWLNPFITDKNGNVAWQATDAAKFPLSIASKQIERGAVKLGARQSCVFDPSQIDLPKNFSGGMSLAISQISNHTLMKVEVQVQEWGAHAFTHFRPGLNSARGYQKPQQRGPLATDYITTGAAFEKNRGSISRDEIIGVINIDDKGISGHPTLEIFTPGGLATRINLGEVPAYSCRHYLLSNLLNGKINAKYMTLRLVDEQATLLMSILHLDYDRRDIALDHGSDRFSTFNDYQCNAPSNS